MTLHRDSPGIPAKRPLRVLVVDDMQDTAESFARLLTAIGCEASFITNPFLAVETAARIRAQAAFLDLGMPGIDGYELARILRRKYAWGEPGAPLILVAVTAYAEDEDRVRSRQAGFDAHVAKPVSPELVESMLQTLFPRLR